MNSELGNQLLGLAEIGGNRLLGMDPKVLRHCAELQGHIIAIELTDLEQTIYCHPGSWGLRLSLQQPATPADAMIKGRLMGLINLSLQQDKVSTSIQEKVEISGDASVAQKFQKILTELDIEWEEQLSGITGDVMAYRIMQGIRNTRQWVRDSFDSLSLSGREYLQEEAHHLPTKVEFERFRQDVTDMRHDVERLQARLNQLLNNKK